ncbi:hypothetical protein D3C87_2186540 [compost metagenome]
MVITFCFQRFDTRLGFVREEFRNDIPLFVKYALRGAETNHLLGFQFDCQLCRDFF